MKYFAVIDVETTGLNPFRSDRIIEVGALLISEAGEIVAEISSLVNPKRDVGPTHIHGLSAGDVLEAPDFCEIAGILVDLLRPASAIVGHNVRFDLSFFRSEFQRLGVEMPECRLIDTMRLTGGHRLEKTCATYGVDFEGTAHSAICDARATSQLFITLLRQGIYLETPDALPSSAVAQWPNLSFPTRKPFPRDEAQMRQKRTPGYIQTLASRLPTASSQPVTDDAALDYRNLLSRTLEDRAVQEDEGIQLVEVALKWGLSTEDVKAIHLDYLRRLVKTACSDGLVTTTEQQDILMVARLLGIEEPDATHLEEFIRTISSDDNQPGLCCQEDLCGKRVCFTGESNCCLNGSIISREMAFSIAEKKGMVVTNSVTRKLDFLIVPDPQTQSGKAKKAREYGIRIIHENEFWRLLGITTEDKPESPSSLM